MKARPVLRTEDSPHSLVTANPIYRGLHFQNKGWWTYEFCYGKHIHQYHIEGINLMKQFRIMVFSSASRFTRSTRFSNFDFFMVPDVVKLSAQIWVECCIVLLVTFSVPNLTGKPANQPVTTDLGTLLQDRICCLF